MCIRDRSLAARYKAEAFAIGDGTAGRETEQLVRGLGLEGVGVDVYKRQHGNCWENTTARRATTSGRRNASTRRCRAESRAPTSGKRLKD